MKNEDKVDVRYLANLARMYVSDEEVEVYQPQLDHVVEYIRKINKLDLSDIEPTSHASLVQNVFRKDEVKPSLQSEDVLRNAPSAVKGQFNVPKIVE